jgi:2-phospho-L-lactate guanylyltransferase
VRVVALVPFKSLTYAKQRLRKQFAHTEVEALGRAMLEDVLCALTSSAGLDSVRVLSDDDEVGRIAEICGATARIQTPDPGLNEVIEKANGEAEAAGVEATLVVLGDLPLIRSIDVEAVIRAGCDASVVLVPSGDGGTAMLFRRPPRCMRARFGARSADRHLEEARTHGIEPVIAEGIPAPIRIDVDTPDDAERILESGFTGRTVELLRKLRKR